MSQTSAHSSFFGGSTFAASGSSTTAAEQQLQMITRKTDHLASTLAQQVSDVKQLSSDRAACASEVEQLRLALQRKEQELELLNAKHAEATEMLRGCALDYSKAQLLQKKYRNSLADMNGFCKTYVFFTEQARKPVANNNRAGAHLRAAPPGSIPSNSLVVADDCTINLPKRNKSLVYDGVFTASGSEGSSSSSFHSVCIPTLSEEVLAGTNHCLFSFGPSGGGKSLLMFGPLGGNSAPAAGNSSFYAPIVPSFLRELFSTMDHHDVTHFNIRITFATIEGPQDVFCDLLEEYSSSTSNQNQLDSAAQLRAVTVQSVEEAMKVLQMGQQRLQHHGQRGGARFHHHHHHTVFALAIENFNRRGHFRKATMTFVDVCGVHPSSSDNRSATADTTNAPLHQWLHRGVSSLCNAISVLSAATSTSSSSSSNQQQPQHNPALQQQLQQQFTRARQTGGALLHTLTADALGGNCKTAMLVVCDVTEMSGEADGSSGSSSVPADGAEEAVLSALTYGLYLKGVRNHPVPHDIPAELQRLNMEGSYIAGEM